MTEPTFTTNWLGSIDYWPDMFKQLDLIGKPNLRFLEIGCFEGRTTLWLLENVLTDPSSQITVIDTFKGSAEFEPLGIDSDFWKRFEHNLAAYWPNRDPEMPKLLIDFGSSQDVLARWNGETYEGFLQYQDRAQFDFIYIDGSHMAADVLSDAVLSWPLLKQGGAMCFDDLHWGANLPEWQRPQIAIEAFVSCYAPQLAGAPQGHDQFVVIKNISTGSLPIG